MSRRETVAERIENVRKTVPPPEGRKARKAYASKLDFAAVVGASLASINRWTAGNGYPEPEYQERLSELSRGRYSPQDFARPADRAVLLAEVEDLVALGVRVVEELPGVLAQARELLGEE